MNILTAIDAEFVIYLALMIPFISSHASIYPQSGDALLQYMKCSPKALITDRVALYIRHITQYTK